MNGEEGSAVGGDSVSTDSLRRENARRRIEHEDHLINHRVSWLMGSHSFLLTAFVLLRNNPAYYTMNAASPGFIDRTSLLVYLISIVGMVTAVCTGFGVMAAFFAITRWRRSSTGPDSEYLTSNLSVSILGGLAAVLPAPVLLSTWGLLLHAEWQAISSQLSFWERWLPVLVGVLVTVFWSAYTLVADFGFAPRRRKG